VFDVFLVGLVAALRSPVVPVSVQDAISSSVEAQVAYVPTTSPAGYHYVRWMRARTRPRALTILFRWHRSRYPGLGFTVAEGCPKVGGAMRLFRFGRVSVRWSTTYTDAQAWRCVQRDGRQMSFYVSAPGYGLAGSPSPRSLALMVAGARALRR